MPLEILIICHLGINLTMYDVQDLNVELIFLELLLPVMRK